jgi:hypothetical protein
MCELEGADGGIVGLEDGLEIKCETIPEGKFSAC